MDAKTVKGSIKQRMVRKNYAAAMQLRRMHVMSAVICGNAKAVRHFLDRNVNRTAKVKHDSTLLHQAIMANHPNIVDILLKADANANALGQYQWTPLHLAAYLKQATMVRKLIAIKSVNLEAQQRDGHTALHLAARQGSCEVVKALLDGGADIEARTNKMCTPLQLSIEGCHLDVFKMLLSRGANLNAVYIEQLSALHWMLTNGLPIDGAKNQLAGSMDVKSENVSGCTPLMQAVEQDRVDVCQPLLLDEASAINEDNTGYTVLHILAAGKVGIDGKLLTTDDCSIRLQLARLLVKHGSDVNARSSDHCTPLYLAIRGGQTAMVRYLLDEGRAAVRLVGPDCPSLLHLAVTTSKTLEIVEAIVDACFQQEIDVNHHGIDGVTALHEAAGSCDADVVKVLLAAGCYYDTSTTDNEWPVAFARSNRHSGPVEALFLLAARFFNAVVNNRVSEVKECLDTWGELVSCRSCRWMSPLHHSAWVGFAAVVELLLVYGANPNAADGDNCVSPLHHAARFGQLDVAVVLLKHGAIFDIVYASNKKTPLMYAVEAKKRNVVPLLETVEGLFQKMRMGDATVVEDLGNLEKDNEAWYRAILNARNSMGQRLVDMAKENGLYEIQTL